jgi:hypothetical protein
MKFEGDMIVAIASTDRDDDAEVEIPEDQESIVEADEAQSEE